VLLCGDERGKRVVVGVGDLDCAAKAAHFVLRRDGL
jgi:hypothetical protein